MGAHQGCGGSSGSTDLLINETVDTRSMGMRDVCNLLPRVLMLFYYEECREEINKYVMLLPGSDLHCYFFLLPFEMCFSLIC